MRIAQVAPLWETVPPQKYGGTELVVSLLTEELVKLGHQVTLFAVKASETQAQLVPGCDIAFRSRENQLSAHQLYIQVMACEAQMLGQVFQNAEKFDMIHNHLGFQALPFAPLVKTPVVSTLHNAIEEGAIRQVYQQYADLPYIAISQYQQTLWPELNYEATIHHGIPLEKFQPCYQTKKSYLAFFGRLAPEKGAHLAIDAARQTGWPLQLAGKIDRVDRAYYDQKIAPHINGVQIRYIGELDHKQKTDFLANAAAVLHPVQWPEPFGLVMIEAMACGTPVLALKNGSIPEIVQDGISGFVCETQDDLIQAVAKIPELDRHQCRKIAEDRFSLNKMVDAHVELYEKLLAAY